MNQHRMLYLIGTIGDMTDAELLDRVVESRGEAADAAFAALVERHGGMVHAVCKRILRDPHDAQDAFQATFLVLAQRASLVRKRDSAANWLYGVALRVSQRARVDAARRRLHERQASGTSIAPTDRHEGWSELHEEVDRLPSRFREAVVLCYLEGLTADAAARRLGCPRGTVLSRLARARDRLRASLERRGVSSASLFTASSLRVPSTSAVVPSTWIEAILEVVAGRPAVSLSPVAASLAGGFVRAVMVGRWLALAASVTTFTATAITIAGIVDFGSSHAETSIPRVEEGDAGVARTSASEKERALTPIEALAAQLKRHPAPPGNAENRLALFLFDTRTGEATRIADEPSPGLSYCEGAEWSHDGKHILFDIVTPDNQLNRARLQMLESGASEPIRRDLGPGILPSMSLEGDQIACIWNPGRLGGAEWGLSLAKIDGSDRTRLGGYERPKISPNGRLLMACQLQTPSEVKLWELESGTAHRLDLSGRKVFSIPSWADGETIVAMIGDTSGDEIALIDVSDPARAKVREILWKRRDDSDFKPRSPVYSPATGRCVFIARAGLRRSALYFIERDRLGPPERLEPSRSGERMEGLGLSPDGRYLLFSSDRADQSEQDASQ